ncbi:hypothetical protein [Nitratireductor sp. XY-223]|uniref:hypothetical protein n=1 Tax=Nitratireductor sp. XY-223 TaxID=2561926 RepID=UPI0010AAB847|nr:hypothetical protein [Nitratireductor sp. XY-223]
MRMFEYRSLHRPAAGFRSICRRSAVLAGGVLLTCSLLTASPVAAGDGINCSCVANGQRVQLGELFCIRTASGKQFLARCERVLNNTSWKRLQDGCPSARNWSEIQIRPVL